MGLDMYVYRIERKIQSQKELEDVLQNYDIPCHEIYYFRKHSDLHGYFEKLFAERSDRDVVFNCEPLLLTKEDILNLRKKVIEHLLTGDAFEEAYGFFWGSSDIEDWRKTLRMCDDILNHVDFEKESIYYDSWW